MHRRSVLAPARAGAPVSTAVVLLLGCTVLAATVVGCTAQTGSVTQPTSEGSASAQGSPAAAATFAPDAGAEGNRAAFDAVNARTAASIDAGEGDVLDAGVFVEALADAGFHREDMEATSGTTAINLAASAVEFSVHIDGECLIGQYGPDLGYHSIVAAPLGSGTCLVGRTEPLG